MTESTGFQTPLKAVSAAYDRGLRLVVYGLLAISGAGVLAIMLVTCADVILRLRWINRPFIGAYDIVKILGALSLASSLPYTTAVKGHVAIEYFFHKLNRRGRIVVDSVMRVLTMVLFAFLAWRSVLYGLDFRRTGQVSQTLQLPVFWVPYVIGFCCAIVVLVVGHSLIHPDREMIKP
ncbi:TRAP transporter small permease [Anaerobaca lacustris]|uniref:TRAP transporter small permease n=1 Tax=Anaerobaca lacustris TaxID=3044600 RepID=A0AAW6TSG4_9BACT|nr:TRAP transporter small permease [Sedimentisphaerales bacterium M17dextr]